MEFPLAVLYPSAKSPAPRNHRSLKAPSILSQSSAILFPPLLRPPTMLGASDRGGSSRRLCAGTASGANGLIAEALHDGGAAALVTAGGYSLVLALDNLARRNLIEQSLSRKIVHVLSGICYMASWPIFSSSSQARYFAAVVPLLNCARLLFYGLSIATNEGVIKSITREGKPEELLKGPLYYVLTLMFSSLIFWRESPIGIISLAVMSGGDGFADILGRRYGSRKLPYNKKKSWVGSISMFMFGFIFSSMMLYYFSALGYLRLDWESTVEKVALVALAAAFMESLPISDAIDDNITVPVTTMAAAFLVFGY
ncbi:hypothetical protein KSP39_PZI024032 [Platanthera zijinensis]|uniref:phytol kinase n=1 Tax=Platanthera zijinensis TaxID=2320716 RepID=A0AAP0FUA1_9ASPA